MLGENRLLPLLTLNVAVGPPALLSITNNAGLSGKPGDVLPFKIRVTDAGGNATSNVDVSWSVVSGAATLSAATTTTDASGDTSNTVTLGAGPGPVRLRAQVNGGLSADVTVTTVLGVSSLQILAGDNQATLTGALFDSALVVRATDAGGAPVAAIPVQFSASGATLTATMVNTDAMGVASVRLTAGPNPGLATVTATAQGVPVVFGKLTVFAPGPRFDAAAIRNFASGEVGLSPCGLATLTGFGLAPGVSGVLRALEPSATSLGPVDAVMVGGRAAVLREVSNVEGQEAVVFQTPCGTPVGPAEVSTTVQGVTARVAGVTVSQYQPGVFLANGDTAWALHGDGSAVSFTSPAVRGEVVRIFATGLGTDAELVLGINDAGVPLVSRGTLDGQPGLYYVEMAIPVDFASRNGHVDFVIAVKLNGQSIYSNTVPVPVRE